MYKIKNVLTFILLALLLSTTAGCADKTPQTAKLTVDLIYGNTSLWGKSITGVEWMPDNKGFTYCEFDPQNGQSLIWYYDLKSLKKSVILDDSNIGDLGKSAASENFDVDSYILSPTGKELLLTSATGLFLYNLDTGKLQRLTQDPAAEAAPQFSPDGTRIAFLKNNNIHVIEIEGHIDTQLTSEGNDHLLVGQVDWVYGEEFGIDKGFYWSPDSQHIAYFKMDESNVPEFPITDFIPVQNEVASTRYPKAGENNSVVTVGVVSLKDNTTRWIDIGDNTDIYIPRIKWLPCSDSLAIQRLNRSQNKLDLLLADINTGKTSAILKEESTNGWIDIYDDLTFIESGKRFIWSSNQSGFKHLYLYDINGEQVHQLTDGEWEVDDLAGVDESNDMVYFRATEKASWERQLYSVDLEGNGMQRLTHGDGWHIISMSTDFSYYLDSFSTYIEPNKVILYTADGKELAVIESNSIPALQEFNLVKPEFITFMTDYGVELPTFIIKPPDFNPNKKYPVLMYTYGGPAIQVVCNQWEDDARKRNLWHEMMAQEGYIIFALDNRGTPARGRDFAQAIYRQWGTVDVLDKIAGVKYLQKLQYVDSSRIGIWGWSHGGYMTCMCMLKGADYFKTGIAVAPPTNWYNYDTIYTERYMGTPQDNPEGYKKSATLSYIGNLKGKLLVIHGTADDNVHIANTMQLVYALENSRKPFDLMIYPRKKHHMDSQDTKVHMYNLMTDYIKQNL
jgi:dipeptidyl-peptidase-4